MRYHRRLLNYRLFRERLNVPLVTVELAYGADFELTEDDADILVQLRGKDVIWQKERLLNVALRYLPSTCRKFVWVDCDVIFEADDWPERVSHLLDRFWVVQTFSHLHHMPRDRTPGESETKPEFTQQSITFMIASGVPAAACLARRFDARELSSAPGIAWAARRELIDKHSFYDTCIMGGGDMAIAAAAQGCIAELMLRHHMNDQQKERYLAWAKPVYDDVRADVGFVDCRLFHLWHGDLRNRRILQRHQSLSRFHFDPFEDIAIDQNGCWRWSSDKPEMHAYVRDYFASRKEDG